MATSIAGFYPIASLDGPFGAFSAQVDEANGVDAGEFVKPTGATEATTANYNNTILIEVAEMNANGDEALICGIAMYDASDNKEVSVATRGIFLLRNNEDGAIAVGETVCPIGGGGTHGITTAEAGGRQVGTALTGCSAVDEYVIVLITGIAGHTGAMA